MKKSGFALVPSSPDSPDDTHLVTSYGYNLAGDQSSITDPRGIVGMTYFDMLGRTTETVAAYTNGVPTSDTNQTTQYTYDGNGDVLIMTAIMPTGQPSQTTQYVYGVSPSAGSTLFSNDLIATTEYPDPVTGAASSSPINDVSYSYDNLGETISKTDQTCGWSMAPTSAPAAAAGARKKSIRSTRSNPTTTTWVAAAADGDQSSTWLLTASRTCIVILDWRFFAK